MSLGRMRMEGWDLAKGFFLGLWNFFKVTTGDTGQSFYYMVCLI